MPRSPGKTVDAAHPAPPDDHAARHPRAEADEEQVVDRPLQLAALPLGFLGAAAGQHDDELVAVHEDEIVAPAVLASFPAEAQAVIHQLIQHNKDLTQHFYARGDEIAESQDLVVELQDQLVHLVLQVLDLQVLLEQVVVQVQVVKTVQVVVLV